MGAGFSSRHSPGAARRLAMIWGAVAVLVAVAWWGLGALARARIADAVPPRPDLADRAPELGTRIAAAEGRARDGDPTGLAELGLLYQANGYLDEATRCYETLAADEADTGPWAERLTALRAAQAQGGAVDNRDVAVAWFEELDSYGFDAARLAVAATVAAEAGDDAVARRRMERALELDPENGSLHFQAALLWERLRNQVDAMAAYATAVRLDPTLVDAWLRLIALNRAIGETSKAVRMLGEALQANPQSAVLLLADGRARRERGRLEEALAQFERVIALEPTAAAGYLEAAQVLFALDRQAEGVARLERSLEVQPGNPAALVMLTVAAISGGDQADADRRWAQLAASPQVSPADRARLAAGYEDVFGASPPN